jgi:hypothetical protein
MKRTATCLAFATFRSTSAPIKAAQKAVGTAPEPAELLRLGGKSNIAASLFVILSRFITEGARGFYAGQSSSFSARGAPCTSVQARAREVRLISTKSSLVAAIVGGGAR